MRIRSLGSLVVLLLGVTALPAAAQRRGLVEVDPTERGGFWASIGGAAGIEKANLLDGNGYSNSLTNPVLQIRLGGTVNEHWRLGGEYFGWFNSYTDTQGYRNHETVGHVALIAQYYPSKGGLFFKAGPGVAYSTISTDGFYGSDTKTGFSAVGGVGYEINVGRKAYIVPTVDFVQQWYSGGVGEGFRERFINIGLSVQFQSGKRF
jgi:hypothetical protein